MHSLHMISSMQAGKVSELPQGALTEVHAGCKDVEMLQVLVTLQIWRQDAMPKRCESVPLSLSFSLSLSLCSTYGNERCTPLLCPRPGLCGTSCIPYTHCLELDLFSSLCSALHALFRASQIVGKFAENAACKCSTDLHFTRAQILDLIKPFNPALIPEVQQPSVRSVPSQRC